jgi:hypothetical protein
MVSAINGVGVQEMLKTLRADMGFRADLWVVGAQNGAWGWGCRGGGGVAGAPHHVAIGVVVSGWG